MSNSHQNPHDCNPQRFLNDSAGAEWCKPIHTSERVFEKPSCVIFLAVIIHRAVRRIRFHALAIQNGGGL